MYEPLHAPLADYATADHDLLAELDGVRYHRAEIVIKKTNGSYAGVYCDYRSWDKTAAGIISRQQQIIDHQQAALALLAQRANDNEDAATRLPTLANNAVRLSAENLALRTAVAALQAELTRALNERTSYEHDQAEEVATHAQNGSYLT